MGHKLKCPDCSKKFLKRSTFIAHWNQKHGQHLMVWERPGKKPTKGK